MRTFFHITLAVLAFAVCFANVSEAQDASNQPNIIEQLQGKGVLTDEDASALAEWMNERVKAVVSDNPPAAAAAVADLRGSWRGTPAYLDAYAAACAEAVKAAYPAAPARDAARLIAVLALMENNQMIPVLAAAVADERAVVRSAAVVGLRRLQAKIAAAGGSAFSDVVAALREAGSREESAVTLKLIYAALDYQRPPDAKTVAEAVLGLIASRGEQYASGGVKAIGADREGLLLAEKLKNEFDENGKRRLVTAAARILRTSVTRYARELYEIDDKSASRVEIKLRNRVELCIEAAEQLLNSLMQAGDEPPSITRAMHESPLDDKAVNMKIEMNKWGDLIQQLYQIDVHMDVAETEGDD